MRQTDPSVQVTQRQKSWTATELVLADAALTAILMIPAFYNRFPFVFPDTSAYLSVAYAQSWPIDRAGFYGLFLAPLLRSVEPPAAIWLAVAMQATIVSLILLAGVRRLLPKSSPWMAVAASTPIALLTALPWHVTQLMPDAFTGSLILLVWLAASRNVGAGGTGLLWLAAAALALLHYTHVGLVAVGTAGTLLVCGFAGTPLGEIGKRALAAALTVVAVLAAHAAIYGIYFDRWTPSPLGGYFLFARVNEDGLVPRWMDRHCGLDAPKPLCDLRPQIPRDSQVLLWGKGPSPLYDRINRHKGEPESWRWVDMVSDAAGASIKEEPLAFLGAVGRATIGQFVHYEALDDECPENCRNLQLFDWEPSLTQPVRASRQVSGTLPRELIRSVTSAVSTIGLLLLVPYFAIAIRRRDVVAQSLLATVALCFVANAAMAGGLSDVHDRYQSRLIWLAPFAILLLFLRWRKWRARKDSNL